MRGDYEPSGVLPMEGIGPSPHAWGLRQGRGHRPRALRAIPTCVGTTVKRNVRTWARPGHPHMRGDYVGGRGHIGEGLGPSPHAWGLRLPGGLGRHEVRAIPTCVGTTPTPAVLVGPEAGHPHMRGDYTCFVFISLYLVGPSPHAWGLLGLQVDRAPLHRAIPTCVGTTALGFLVQLNPRAIPTCVGTTLSPFIQNLPLFGPSPHAWGLRPPWWRSSGNTSGHPHMRGDYASRVAGSREASGPSPHAWGLRLAPFGPRHAGRAIPTCVGTTAGVVLHVRTGPGPSPHAWGLLLGNDSPSGEARAIPTCVGTTSRSFRVAVAGTGHPHMRGDYAEEGVGVPPPSGPSPHAWGLLVHRDYIRYSAGPSPHAWGLPRGSSWHLLGDRAIPTCVGTTGWSWCMGPPDWRAIPTCVGTTPKFKGISTSYPGHPHMRGDYTPTSHHTGASLGPSPHAWGLHMT